MFQVIDGIQMGFVWTNYLPSSWHRVLLSSPIPVVLKLERVSGVTKRTCSNTLLIPLPECVIP